jgi:hypothetical protein
MQYFTLLLFSITRTMAIAVQFTVYSVQYSLSPDMTSVSDRYFFWFWIQDSDSAKSFEFWPICIRITEKFLTVKM